MDNRNIPPRSCGPFAVMMSYTSEVMPTKYRSTVMLLLGSAFSLSNVLIPGIGMFVLPLEQSWKVTDGFSSVDRV